MTTAVDETKATAESHATSPTVETPADDAGLDLSLMKKKKKKVKIEGEEGDAAVDEGEGDGGLDLSMKKKKKKKVKEPAEDDEFAAKIKALDLEKDDAAAATEEVEEEGDMDAGTGIWAHDETRSLGYNLLLKRFFAQLSQKNPDHDLKGTRNYKIPSPQCAREGNKKTAFANISDICKRMKRSEDHVIAYLFAELGTSGSVDGSRRLIIKGRFQQKQIENVLRKYIIEYLTCKTCKSLDTDLNKGENRLFFITCNACGSRRSVAAIKAGFSAQIGKRKKM